AEALPAPREDPLRPPVAAALASASCGVALDDVELGQRGGALRAVGELPGERARLEQALALHQVARLARSLSCPGGGQRLLDDPAAFRRALFEVLRQAFSQRE